MGIKVSIYGQARSLNEKSVYEEEELSWLGKRERRARICLLEQFFFLSFEISLDKLLPCITLIKVTIVMPSVFIGFNRDRLDYKETLL